ncbi:MarR family transcriptional regulator [Nocardiopsis sp. CNR-923]|uniref:GbsR/MarR family transcriptional regulator n=1 Tax=Nocardiopsis sp. CNR-923 TaxID=1904965 RepID=UPI000963A061|nr:helix-turn-helix domain-containing protein [Nocardiopsis sp. CNR-923]OLT29764.1 MarR family transcriptional regulator [Nocardiopsis sp. CNR-923]
MPGGRLTREERERIAAGLARGLGYAEIARRLGRPTSTVSREVARNGGRAAYRPGRAQRSTDRRARRRGRATGPHPPPQDTVHRGRDPEAVRASEEEFTEALVDSGVSRMVARVLTVLCMTDGAGVTTAELVRRLQVSPASVSLAVRYLEDQDLLKREREPGGRRDRYVVDEDVWFQSMLASVRANVRLAEAARRGGAALGAGTPGGDRLTTVGAFLAHINEDLLQSVQHWRRVLAERRG